MIETVNDVPLWGLPDAGPPLGSESNAVDIIGEAHQLGAAMIGIPAGRLDPAFLRLSSGMAGAFIEKLQQYGYRLAVVGDIAAALEASGALRDFVRETNRRGQHLFVHDEAELRAKLAPYPPPRK